jgi:hypothetical protein
MSKEHLWPQWARKTLEDDLREQRVSHSLHDDTGDAYETWDAAVFSSTLKRVCVRCNNTWMSRLEARAQPHAEPLLLGESRTLDRNAQIAIAMWGHLKCLLFVFLAGGPMEEAMGPAARTFYEIQGDDLPPLHVSVFVAHHIGPRQGQYQHRLLGNDPDRPSLLVQTFTIRELTVQVVRNFHVRAPVELERDPAIAGSDHRIWPPAAAFAWPPGPGLDDDGLTIYTGPMPK